MIIVEKDDKDIEFLGSNTVDMETIMKHDRPRWKKWRAKIRKVKSFFVMLPRKLKWRYQKVTMGWSDRDLWSLDHYLADKICSTLKEYNDIKHGYPILEKRDEDGEIVTNKSGTIKQLDHEESEAQWDAELELMIDSFEKAKKIGENEIQFVNPRHWSEERYESLVEIYGEENVLDKQEAEEMFKGMHLFIDRFFALWD